MAKTKTIIDEIAKRAIPFNRELQRFERNQKVINDVLQGNTSNFRDALKAMDDLRQQFERVCTSQEALIGKALEQEDILSDIIIQHAQDATLTHNLLVWFRGDPKILVQVLEQMSDDKRQEAFRKLPPEKRKQFIEELK